MTVVRSKRIDAKARELCSLGMKRLDAQHLASALAADASFVTLDKEVLHLAKRHAALRMVVVKPSEWAADRGVEEE